MLAQHAEAHGVLPSAMAHLQESFRLGCRRVRKTGTLKFTIACCLSGEEFFGEQARPRLVLPRELFPPLEFLLEPCVGGLEVVVTFSAILVLLDSFSGRGL